MMIEINTGEGWGGAEVEPISCIESPKSTGGGGDKEETEERNSKGRKKKKRTKTEAETQQSSHEAHI